MAGPPMTWWQRLLEFLASLFKPKAPPVGPPPTTTTPPPTTTTPPPRPPVGLTFPEGNIKTEGPSGRDLSFIPWANIARWEPLYTQASLDPRYGRNRFGALFLACVVVIESEGQQYVTGKKTGIPREALRGHGDPRSVGLTQIRYDLHDPSGLFVFEPAGNLNLAAKLWADWMTSEGSWEAALANKWHPGTDPVSRTTVQEYIRCVRDLIAEVKASWVPIDGPGPVIPDRHGTLQSVEGLTQQVVLPFPLHVDLLPVAQKNQRPGIAMAPTRYIQHETGNPNPGANAQMHRNYLFGGARDDHGVPQKLSYHFTVDEHEAWQLLPVNEVAWHGGDGSGPCNFKGLACELTIEAGQNKSKARDNAAILAAEIMNAVGMPMVVTPDPHVSCSGTDHHCPHLLLSEGAWEPWQGHVRQLRRSRRAS